MSLLAQVTALTIYTDGGSRGNPGPAGIGVSIVDASANQEIASISQYIGQGTNNEAEYQAIIASLKWLQEQDLTNVTEINWLLDSKLVVEQLSRNWNIKDDRMRALAQKAWKVLDSLSAKTSLSHVPRAENKRADELVNMALDAEQL